MKPAQITTLVVVSLVALRLGCGWLFFREGSKKLDSGTFTSQHFLREARGPFAGAFHSMVPDMYGQSRLNWEETRQNWDFYREDAAAHFQFDDAQQSEALKAFDAYLVGRGPGPLDHEAMAGRAMALEALGRSSDEARAWQALLARFPETLFRDRARARLTALERGP